MGLMINGEWRDEWYDTKSTAGRFVRRESFFRDWVTADGSSGFKAEPNRYHLYISLACPWAHTPHTRVALRDPHIPGIRIRLGGYSQLRRSRARRARSRLHGRAASRGAGRDPDRLEGVPAREGR